MPSWSSHTGTDIRRRSSPVGKGVPYALNVNQPATPLSLYGSPSNGITFASPGGYSQPPTPNSHLDPNMSHHSSYSSANPMARYMENPDAPFNPLHLSTTPTLPDGLSQDPSITQSSSFMATQGSTRSDSATNVTTVHNAPAPAESNFYRDSRTFSTGSVDPSALDAERTAPVKQVRMTRSSPKSTRPANARAVSSVGRATSSKGDGELDCPHCSVKPRLKSELKKHILRHERPFKCDHVDCPRYTSGFTTPNDLDRHKRSKHKVFPDTAKVYICASVNCVEHGKAWPRYDNFKQHVERMHKMEDMQTLLEKSEKPANSVGLLKTTDDSDSNPVVHQQPRTRPLDRTTSSRTVPTPAKNTFGSYDSSRAYGGVTFDGSQSAISRSDQLSNADSANDFDAPYAYAASVGADPRYDHFSANQFDEQNLSLDASNVNHMMSYNYDDPLFSRTPEIVVHQSQDHKRQQDSDFAHMMPGGDGPALDETFAASAMDTAPDSWRPDPALSFNGYRLATHNRQPLFSRYGTSSSKSSGRPPNKVYKANSVAGSRVTVVNDNRGDRKNSGGAQCSKCKKILPRQCDLKKHERRHTRPFGCTFDLCNKQFGSKNDWKRHESSQHFQEEQWRCQMPIHFHTTNSNGSADAETTEQQCAEVFNDWPHFSSHLTSAHGVHDQELHALKDSNRIGRNHQRTFWCGFCREIKVLAKAGRKAWDERFDHIGEHFVQHGRPIRDWVSPQGHRSKGQMRSEAQVGTWPAYSDAAAAAASDEKAENEDEKRDMDLGDAAGEKEEDEEEEDDDEDVDVDDAPDMELDVVQYCCQCHDGPWSSLTGHCACVNCGHSCSSCFGRSKAHVRQPQQPQRPSIAIGVA